MSADPTDPAAARRGLPRARARTSIEPMPPFEHPLMDAIGLPVAEDVHAPVSLPVFDNSGMDGYAVAFRDVADATRGTAGPPAGGRRDRGRADDQIFTLTPGTAVRIMTGAPVPTGCTAVVPFEWTEERVARCSSAGRPRSASTSASPARRSRRATS